MPLVANCSILPSDGGSANQLEGNQPGRMMPGVVPGESASDGLENPHEILGLPADEADAVAIVEAAAAKLRAVRAANGSELAVRRAVEAVIVTARKLMLAKTPESGTFGHGG